MDDDKPESIAAMMKSLELARERAVGDLQKTVHRSYGDFVQITKELSGFEGQMNELHSIINQLSTLSETLLINVPVGADHIEAPAEEPEALQHADDAGAAVPSMSDLVEKRAKINRLLDHVGELGDYLAEATGRHIVFDGVDLMSVSGKASHPVYLYLLNDSVIATSRKAAKIGQKLQLGQAKKYVLDFTIPYAEFSVEEVPEDDPAHVQDALRFLRNKSEVVATIQFDSPTQKKLWSDQIKRATITYKMEEASKNSMLNMQPVKERYVKKANRSSLAARAAHRRAASSSAHRKAAELAASTAGILDMPVEHYNNWISDFATLDKACTLRNYDMASCRADDLTANLRTAAQQYPDSPRVHSLRRLLDAKKRRMADLLLAEISRPLVSRSEMVLYIDYLAAHGYADAARECFFTARSEFIRKRGKALPYQGNVQRSVQELSQNVFAGIKSTAEWYRAAFKEPVRMSGLMFWIRLEIVEFCSVLSKLVFHGDLTVAEMAECMDDARQHCEILLEVGLNFMYLFDASMANPLGALMDRRVQLVSDAVGLAVREDQFVEFATIQGQQVAHCGRLLHEQVHGFVADFEALLKGELGEVLATRLVIIFDHFAKEVLGRFYVAQSSIQSHALIAALEFASDELLVSIYRHISVVWACSVPV